MVSRRVFLRLLSWGAAGLSAGQLSPVLDPEGITSDQNGTAKQAEGRSGSSDGRFDYYVSNLVDADLRHWRARLEGDEAHLAWQTRYERQVRQFVVQHRCVSGTESESPWNTVATVEGQGTTVQTTDYRHVVSDLGPGTHRFRLTQVDEEGRTEMTDPVSVDRSGLIEWKAKETERGIRLRWEGIFFDDPPETFVVEHRSDGNDEGGWQSLGVVETEADALNPRAYQYTAEGLEEGGHQFRLKQVNESGAAAYTDPVSARVSGIVDWRAEAEEERVVLRWRTTAEHENEGFSVQYRNAERDNSEWRELTFVEGRGTTSRPQEYRYVASGLPPGENQFRLKKVDTDGDAVYTDSVAARVNGILEWTGSEANEGLELVWRTATPNTGLPFVIEHRKPGRAGDEWEVRHRIEERTESNQTEYRYLETDLASGDHQFRLGRRAAGGSMEYTDPITVHQSMEKAVRLTPPSPNPVRGQATFSFAVRTKQAVTVKLYDVLGRAVRTLYRGTPPAEETQTVRLSGTDRASGVYFVRLTTTGHSKMRKFTIVE